MTVFAIPGSTFVPYVTNAGTGNTGSVGLEIYDPATSTAIVPRFTAGIVETPAGSAIYYAPAQTAPDTEGTYQLIWDSPASTVDAVEDLIVTYSLANPDPVDLCTVHDVQLRFSTSDDPAGIIQAAITAASRKVNQRYNRELTPQTNGEARIFRLNSNLLAFGTEDLRAAAVSGVVLDPLGTPTVLDTTQFRLTPTEASSLGTYTGIRISNQIDLNGATARAFGYAELAITGDWGAFTTATVPEDIRDAAVETVGSWLDRAVAQYAGVQSQAESEFIATPDRFAGYSIPPTAHAVFSQYDRITLR